MLAACRTEPNANRAKNELFLLKLVAAAVFRSNRDGLWSRELAVLRRRDATVTVGLTRENITKSFAKTGQPCDVKQLSHAKIWRQTNVAWGDGWAKCNAVKMI